MSFWAPEAGKDTIEKQITAKKDMNKDLIKTLPCK
jgi:hypothetical protein